MEMCSIFAARSVGSNGWKDNNWALGAFLPHAQDGTAPTRLAARRSSHIPLFSPRSCSHPFPTDQPATAGDVLSKLLSWVKMA